MLEKRRKVEVRVGGGITGVAARVGDGVTGVEVTGML